MLWLLKVNSNSAYCADISPTVQEFCLLSSARKYIQLGTAGLIIWNRLPPHNTKPPRG